KPSNIIFVSGVPKLADIGLVTEADTTLSYVGTEGYIPPEGPGAAQADIFSLGKVLYEISTGQDRRQFPDLPPNLKEWPIKRPCSNSTKCCSKLVPAMRACVTNPPRRCGLTWRCCKAGNPSNAGARGSAAQATRKNWSWRSA